MGKFGSWDEGVGNFIRENSWLLLKNKGGQLWAFHIHPLIWQPSPRQWCAQGSVGGWRSQDSTPVFWLQNLCPVHATTACLRTHISAPSSENLLFSGVFLSYSWVLAAAQRSAWGRMLCLGQRQGCRDPTSHFYFQLQGSFWCLLPAGQPGSLRHTWRLKAFLDPCWGEFTEPDFFCFIFVVRSPPHSPRSMVMSVQRPQRGLHPLSLPFWASEMGPSSPGGRVCVTHLVPHLTSISSTPRSLWHQAPTLQHSWPASASALLTRTAVTLGFCQAGASMDRESAPQKSFFQKYYFSLVEQHFTQSVFSPSPRSSQCTMRWCWGLLIPHEGSEAQRGLMT